MVRRASRGPAHDQAGLDFIAGLRLLAGEQRLSARNAPRLGFSVPPTPVTIVGEIWIALCVFTPKPRRL
jgi:hypothetical protein